MAQCPVISRYRYHLDGRHATGTRGRNRLPVAPVRHVAAGKNSGDSEVHIFPRLQVAIRVVLQHPVEDRRVRNVSNAQEHRARRKVPNLAGQATLRSFSAVTSFAATSITSSTTVSVIK